ncbi:uncharacterized protein LOC128681951 [Plodia interpunctella]|uniref:uncharacterized protein LOC128681951 n=1 Tax=Plodia interpunctella TaxID=58824 RepID=UPI002367B8FD|nr:uncharacterized protein LOC128681951 [Plodia interpunctella]
MNTLTILIFVALFACAMSKNGVRTLTESLGQEVIEIGTPIKELPADIEEEPSIENEEDEHVTTPTPITSVTTTKPSTKRDPKKPALLTTSRPRKANAILNSEEEEDRIEKELADIYKDTIDYRDSAETTSLVVMKIVPALNKTTATVNQGNSSKSILRSNDRENFKFQPDPFNKAEIERFRTSVDDISCGKKLKAPDDKKGSGNYSFRIVMNILVFNFCLFARLLI